MQYPKLLVVGTVPYNNQSSSRALDAYFHFWNHDCIAHVFSNAKTPSKGHCNTLYQITDERLLRCWLRKDNEPGRIFSRDELPEKWENNELEVKNSSKKAYRFGAKHSPFTHILRKFLWRKKYWCTKQFVKWIDAFNPECVFVCSSDDFFIYDIAIFVSNRFNIPIVTAISDDYCFNYSFSLNPLYNIYKLSYKHFIKRVYKPGAYGIYISNKIRDKYNTEFGMKGETVYLTSTVKRVKFKPVRTDNPLITYFGNIRMGRNHSLNDIANALKQINADYKLEVYSNESNPDYYEELVNNSNIIYGGSIPYAEVQAKMADSDITVIVEGFTKDEINWSRYSLSTKAADSLASGVAILTYGSSECGIVEYMQSTKASFVCTDKQKLVETIRGIFSSPDIQIGYYDQQILITQEHHNLEKSCATVEQIVKEAIRVHNGK